MRRPPGRRATVEILRRQLEAAIAAEEFEEAARLRDQIRKLGDEERRKPSEAESYPPSTS